jgi:hypothetical protein
MPSTVRHTLDLVTGFQEKRRYNAIKCKKHPDFKNFKMWKKCILNSRKYGISPFYGENWSDGTVLEIFWAKKKVSIYHHPRLNPVLVVDKVWYSNGVWL